MKSPPQPSPEFYEEIGRLCAAWAVLEASIQDRIWELLGVGQEVGQHVTYSLDAKRRWQTLQKIAGEKSPALHAAMKSNQTEMENLARDRNLAIHGLVVSFLDTEELHWVVFKGAKAGHLQPASLEKVRDIRERTQELAQLIRPVPTADEWIASQQK